MTDNQRWRDVTVTLTFSCHTQAEYDERMMQIRAWIEDLQNILGHAEGSIHIQLEP